MKIADKFDLILKNINKYNISKKKISSIFFCTFADCIGLHLIKFWIDKKNFFPMLKKYLSGIYSSIAMNEYLVVFDKNIINNYDKIIITWGQPSSLSENSYKDKYLNASNKENSQILWIVIMGKHDPKIESVANTIFFFEKKISKIKKVYNFFVYSYLKKFKYNYSLDISFFTQESFFSLHLYEKIVPFLNDKLKVVLMPYENQPFQSTIIKYIKENFKSTNIIGYVHSFPSFPSHFLKSEFCPHKLILNSNDQKQTFQKYLRWNSQELILLPSTRFSENTTSLEKDTIYLPIDFESVDIIVTNFKILSEIDNKIQLKYFKIRNHPAANNSKKHNLLINELNGILKRENSFPQSTKKKAIFVGSTGAIIEALVHGFEVIHIYENKLFDLYHNFLWPSIEMEVINDKIVKYKLINYNSIMFNKNENLLEKYLSI